MIPDTLRNQFLVMRHGLSLANDQSLIISSPGRGIDRYGLTAAGIEQVIEAVGANRDRLAAITKIYSSDFLRTRQTAEIVAETLGLEIEMKTALRERAFGDWEGTSNQHYETVWQADAEDPTHQNWQVESVQQVANRTLRLLNQIDQTVVSEHVLLVSHGDPLQILLTARAGKNLRLHRTLKPLETAEIRPLA